MASQHQSHVPQDATDANCRLASRLEGSFRMSLRAYKLVKSVIVSAFVLAIGTYAIVEGGDPTTLGLATVAGQLVINGWELSEWLAAKQELARIRETDE